MLSDEEKKAIEYLKQNNIVEIQYDNYGLESIHRVGIDEKQTILNLIEKQSKEIEELKEEQAKRQWVHIKENGEVEPLFYVSEDKIKAKIEELQNKSGGNLFHIQQTINAEIRLLQSLLEKE